MSDLNKKHRIILIIITVLVVISLVASQALLFVTQ